MTGAGFGGCAVALVREDSVDGFTGAVTTIYGGLTGLEPRIYVSQASAGASIE